ncbi:MAG: hypothetical protein ABJA83_08750 [Burkholderiaceae bacterium]
MPSRAVYLTLVAFLATPLCAQQPLIPAADIATGKSVWVDSSPGDALLNARVDIGAMRQSGDEFEFSLQWAVSPGLINDLRFKEPALQIPAGSVMVDRERVMCKTEGMLSYALESTIVAPDGKRVRQKTVDSAAERKPVEARGVDRYGPDPRSLVCWAAARKCEGKPFTWPPPPNMTPLEYSPRATAMRAAYDQKFIPSCKL